MRRFFPVLTLVVMAPVIAETALGIDPYQPRRLSHQPGADGRSRGTFDPRRGAPERAWMGQCAAVRRRLRPC
ncbi:MAG: hypothetical protein IRZ31_15435 [Thermogemmatispora sp.]|uniref:hypothetical protein n=1 Tax=Thermogemmatispora sp. TaxID=1968838 RepID=UPI002635504C|nr:hypothetical protein [Thermogemmatispora sp.]MBX5458285.1 hypothetical protein [Thermogemmatispora sp.]